MLCMPNVAYLPSAIGYVLLLPPWAPAPPRQGRMRELGPAATVVGARSCAPDDGAKFVGDGGEDTIRCDPRTWSGEVIRLVVGRLVACGFAAAALWHAEMWPLTCVPMFAHLRTEAWRVGGDGGCVPPFALEQLSRERLSLIGTPSGFASLSLVFTDLDAGGDGGDGGATVALRRRRFDRRVVYARGHGSRLRGRDRLSEWPTCVRSIAVSAVQETLRARRAAAGAGGASAATSFAADGVASVCGGAARGDAAHELLRHWLPLLSGHYEFRHLDAAASTGLPSRREALVGLELRTLVCGSSNAVAGVAEGGNDAAGGSDHRAVAAVRVDGAPPRCGSDALVAPGAALAAPANLSAYWGGANHARAIEAAWCAQLRAYAAA